MNMTRLPDDEQIEREWQAQERALEQERRGVDAAADEVVVQRYRLLARALRQPPVDALPADFARRLAVRAAAVGADGSVNAGFERHLLQAMIAAFGLAVGAVLVAYGGDGLSSLSEVARLGRALGGRWLLALLACVGVSIAAQRMSVHRNH
jgi:hypothetical protein